jgi:hypothetical protein
MNQKMLLLERKVGGVGGSGSGGGGGSGTSPSRLQRAGGTPQRGCDEASDRLVGKLLLRVEDCERQIDRLKYSANGNHEQQSGSVSSAELKSNIRALGKNTSKAFKQLSAGMGDVQQATLLLYEWADKVHKSFETISYKLEYPTNVCPRVQMHVRNSNTQRSGGPPSKETVDRHIGDFVFTEF